MTIEIVNKRFYEETGVYIGRPSLLGNPFNVDKYDRDACIKKYHDKLKKHIAERDKTFDYLVKLSKIEDLVLICWCKPLSCHGDVIKLEIENIKGGKYGDL